MRKIKLFLMVLVLLMTVLLSACSTIPVQTKPIIEQQSLLKKCTTDTPLPTQFVLDEKGQPVYTGQELYKTLRDWQTVYNDCASTHNKLVDTINGLQEMKEVKK
ncbi:hypothetical protein FDH34_gp160 [Serratia phage BF]|uniref:O-spanin n=1 Tax=Serratia phage BF TaxID=1962671 RepID=A0A1S6UAB6_9CAUD|nr:hypothetical protein FDH34_gp160 [Serratia phage BF]AQW88685.1 hypothetical protein BF_0160 [Serratia phage BF]